MENLNLFRMFKVFNRGNKIQFNDSSGAAIQSDSMSMNHRRQASMRHSNYFLDSEVANQTSNSLNGKFLSSKRFVSCENVRRVSNKYEYADVIDEEDDDDDDENGIKEKLVKRYNSLTSLLMRSFRKAKHKKKKEAINNIHHEPVLATNFEEPDAISNESIESIRNKKSSSNSNESSLYVHNNNINSNNNNSTVKMRNAENNCKIPSKPRRSSDISMMYLSQNSKKPETHRPKLKEMKLNTIGTNKPIITNSSNSEVENEEEDEEVAANEIPKSQQSDDEEEQDDDNSVPVFIGVKKISNEFVDLKPTVKSNHIQKHIEKQTNDSISLKISTPSTKTVSSLSSNLTVRSKSSADSKVSSEHEDFQMARKYEQLKASERRDSTSKYSSIHTLHKREANELYEKLTKILNKDLNLDEQIYSFPLKHSKIESASPLKSVQTSPKQTTETPSTPLSNKLGTKIDKFELDSSESNDLVENFTRNLNVRVKGQAPRAPISGQSNLKMHKDDLAINETSTSTPVKKATVRRVKTFTEQLQDMLQDRKKIASQQQTQQHEVQAAQTIKPASLDSSKTSNFHAQTNDQGNGIYTTLKQINSDLSKIKQSKDVRESEESYNYTELKFINEKKNSNQDMSANSKPTSFNDQKKTLTSTNPFDLANIKFTEPKSLYDDLKPDDFRELVDVLERQDSEFKSKFFDCLMTKLWDTTLPYNEYIQLNKLMTALFGESYHKMDFSTMNNCFNERNAEKKHIDAENIVNLMKIYLDSAKASASNTTNNLNANSLENTFDELNDLNTYSVTNLINTLKRRKHNEAHPKLMESVLNENQFLFINGLNYKEESPRVNARNDLIENLSNALNLINLKNENSIKSQIINGKVEENFEEEDANDIDPIPFVRGTRVRKTLADVYSYSSQAVESNDKQANVKSAKLHANSSNKQTVENRKDVETNKMKPVQNQTHNVTLEFKPIGNVASFQPLMTHANANESSSARYVNKADQAIRIRKDLSQVRLQSNMPPKPKLVNYVKHAEATELLHGSPINKFKVVKNKQVVYSNPNLQSTQKVSEENTTLVKNPYLSQNGSSTNTNNNKIYKTVKPQYQKMPPPPPSTSSMISTHKPVISAYSTNAALFNAGVYSNLPTTINGERLGRNLNEYEIKTKSTNYTEVYFKKKPENTHLLAQKNIFNSIYEMSQNMNKEIPIQNQRYVNKAQSFSNTMKVNQLNDLMINKQYRIDKHKLQQAYY